jgi:hypothetical protein
MMGFSLSLPLKKKHRLVFSFFCALEGQNASPHFIIFTSAACSAASRSRKGTDGVALYPPADRHSFCSAAAQEIL